MDTTRFEPQDPAFAERVRASFARQAAMRTLGARLAEVSAGRAVIELPFAEHLTQQHGFIHGGIVSTVLDSACGYAASSLMPAQAGVLTIEYKVSLLAPAKGERFHAEGFVVKPGRTITFAEGRCYAIEGGTRKLVATMSASLMAVTGRDDVKH